MDSGYLLQLLTSVEVRARRSSSAGSTASVDFALCAARALRWKRDGDGNMSDSELAGLLGRVSAYLLERLVASAAA